MGRVELFAFRFRDALTGKWVRARYRAEREEIARRYVDYEILGLAEIRDADADAPRFTPYAGPRTNSSLRRADESAPQLQPHLAEPRAIDAREAILLRLFLRRYITYCARRGRFAAMNGAACLFAELKVP